MWNPKLKDFLKKDPNKKLISFSWSLYWRLTLIILAIEIGLWIIIALIIAI